MANSLSDVIESVEDLLIRNKTVFRPTTYKEIELQLKGVKSIGSIRREIKRLQKFKIITKIKVEVEGTYFNMYRMRK